jgi:hypothetical protein
MYSLFALGIRFLHLQKSGMSDVNNQWKLVFLLSLVQFVCLGYFFTNF